MSVHTLDSFRNTIPDSVDMRAYAEVESRQIVRPAGQYAKQLLDRMFVPAANRGLELPWRKLEGRVIIRPGEMSVWVGYKGHGKSLALSQVMAKAMSDDERVLILSPEFRPVEILYRKILQCAGESEPTMAYARAWVAWANSRLWLFDHQGGVQAQTVIACLRYAHEKFGITQAVVDSLMKCGIAPDDFEKQKRFVDQLQTFAHDTGCHVHLVAHARKGGESKDHKVPEGHDVKGTSEICDMAENVFAIWKNKKKMHARSLNANIDDAADPDGMLVVDSQRNGNWTGKLALFFHPASGQFMDVGQQYPAVYFEDSSR